MEYRPQTRAPRKTGLKHEKIKAKTKAKKHQSRDDYLPEENTQNFEETVDRTLSTLRNLGNQIFGLPPFSTHFNRWLVNLRDALSQFELSLGISFDEEFEKTYSQILSNVEFNLEDLRCREASNEETLKKLSDAKILLERIEIEHSGKMKEIERQKSSEIRRLSSNIDVLREELERIAHTKMGIFRAISKKTKVQEIEVTQRMNIAKKELDTTEQNFNAVQNQLQDEYERKKGLVINQITESQKEIGNQDVDSSLEIRKATCEALINALNTFNQRRLQPR